MLHLSEERKKIKPHFFTDQEYAKILDSIVVTCVDIVVHTDQEMFLTKRNVFPRKDWWIIGGRMLSGESPLQTAQRKIKEEAGLEYETDKFIYLDAFSTNFKIRQQEPQNHGTHTVSLLYGLRIQEKEKSNLKLIKSEYEYSHWLKFTDVEEFFKSDNFKEFFINIVNKIPPLYD